MLWILRYTMDKLSRIMWKTNRAYVTSNLVYYESTALKKVPFNQIWTQMIYFGLIFISLGKNLSPFYQPADCIWRIDGKRRRQSFPNWKYDWNGEFIARVFPGNSLSRSFVRSSSGKKRKYKETFSIVLGNSIIFRSI